MFPPLTPGTNPPSDFSREHLEKDQFSPQPVTPAEIGWTLDDLDRQHRQFCEYARGVLAHSTYTIAGYIVSYKNFRLFLVETVGIDRPIGYQLFAIEDWMRWNRGRRTPISQVSLHAYWTKLRTFFRYLERQHGIRSPFKALRPPTLPTRIPKARSVSECNRIIESARQYPWTTAFDRMRAVALIGVILYAGLRRSEVLHLRFLDVSFEQNSIRVERGKGRGGGKDRVIPMAGELRYILEDYVRERSRQHIVSPEFFSCIQTKAGMSLSTFLRTIYRVKQASGISFSLHSLRHSFVTQLLRSGVPIHTVSALAGHSQITTTAGYLKVFDEDKADAMKRLRY